MPLFNYIIHQDYIAEFLCINKDKPELACRGKCHLEKELKKQTEKRNKSIPGINLKEYPIGFVFIATFTPQIIRFQKKKKNPFIIQYSYMYVSSIFHPPTI